MIFVPDASVFNKLFLDETDSDQALEFFRYAVATDQILLAPTLLRHEVLKTALHFGVPWKEALKLLNHHLNAGLKLVDPADDIWLTAEKITQTGHPKSGYPSIEDSLYHALAIHAEGTFITTDHRHFQKAKSFGHIELLAGWKPV